MLDKNVRRTLLIDIAAAMLVMVIIQPLLQFLWQGIGWIGANVYEGLSNSIYQNAALGHRNYIAVILLTILCGAIFAMLTVESLYITGVGSFVITTVGKLPRKARSLFVIVNNTALILVLIYFLLLTWSDLQLNTSFQQRLTVLAPEIAEQEYRELRASWASMRTRRDYEMVNAKLDDLAHQRGIELPALLLK